MAHIQDGILSAPVLIAGAVVAVAASGLALRRARESDIPRAGVLASVFFAGSMLAVPVGPTSVHLMFSGLMGLMLGWLAVPAVLAALVLQLVLFGFGGVTTLGVNAVNIALPGVLLALALRPRIARMRAGRAAMLAGIAAGLSVVATEGLVALDLALSAPEFVPAARVAVLAAVPLAVVEGLICAAAIGYLHRAGAAQRAGFAA